MRAFISQLDVGKKYARKILEGLPGYTLVRAKFIFTPYVYEYIECYVKAEKDRKNVTNNAIFIKASTISNTVKVALQAINFNMDSFDKEFEERTSVGSKWMNEHYAEMLYDPKKYNTEMMNLIESYRIKVTNELNSFNKGISVLTASGYMTSKAKVMICEYKKFANSQLGFFRQQERMWSHYFDYYSKRERDSVTGKFTTSSDRRKDFNRQALRNKFR